MDVKFLEVVLRSHIYTLKYVIDRRIRIAADNAKLFMPWWSQLLAHTWSAGMDQLVSHNLTGKLDFLRGLGMPEVLTSRGKM